MSIHSPDDLARALAGIEHDGQVSMAKTTALGEAGHARSVELSLIVRAAMREIAQLSELERALRGSAPTAAGRLRIIGDIAAVSFAKVVVDGTTRLMLADIGEACER